MLQTKTSLFIRTLIISYTVKVIISYSQIASEQPLSFFWNMAVTASATVLLADFSWTTPVLMKKTICAGLLSFQALHLLAACPVCHSSLVRLCLCPQRP